MPDMSRQSEFFYDVASGLSQGRRERQEDQIAFDFPVGVDHGFAILFDGMGGHNAGDIASRVVVTEVFSQLKLKTLSPEQQEGTIRQSLQSAVRHANLRLESIAAQQDDDGIMGATLLAPVLFHDRLYWISVGDSPLFLFRNGTLTRLNEIHSMEAKIAVMQQSGEINAFEAANHPDRYCLTSVLAGYDSPQIDCPEDPLRLRDDDIVVAASDGLEFLSTEQINTVIQDNRDKQSTEISAALLREVDRFDDPDQDNVCLCVIKTCRRSSSDADSSPSGSQESRASTRSSMTVVSAKTENGSSIYRISRKVTV